MIRLAKRLLWRALSYIRPTKLRIITSYGKEYTLPGRDNRSAMDELDLFQQREAEYVAEWLETTEGTYVNYAAIAAVKPSRRD